MREWVWVGVECLAAANYGFSVFNILEKTSNAQSASNEIVEPALSEMVAYYKNNETDEYTIED